MSNAIAISSKNKAEISDGAFTKDYVYVIEFGDCLVKVGRSVDPVRRAKNLSTGSGRFMRRSWTSRAVHNACAYERRVHAALAKFRGLGEWFRCSFEEAVNTAELQLQRDELWTEEGAAKRSAEAEQALEALKRAVLAGGASEPGQGFESFRDSFLNAMRERAITNCITYLHYRDAAEKAYWDAVDEELAGRDAVAAYEIAIVLAFSNPLYVDATRMEHVHLGITTESCMLYTQDVERIPEMFEEIEILARQRRLAETVGSQEASA